MHVGNEWKGSMLLSDESFVEEDYEKLHRENIFIAA